MADRTPDADIAVVVAADEAGGIGVDGHLPWHLPGDLKFFKQVTTGHPVVMGRATHESIGRALPGRTNIVVTRRPDYVPYDGAEVAGSLDDALAKAARAPGGEAIMVIGGAGIFRDALPRATRLYLTRVHATYPADTYLPEIAWTDWRETWRADQPADARDPVPYSFIVCTRADQPSAAGADA